MQKLKTKKLNTFEPNYLSNSNPFFRFFFFSHLANKFVQLHNKLEAPDDRAKLNTEDTYNITSEQSTEYLAIQFQIKIGQYIKHNSQLTANSFFLILCRVFKKDMIIIIICAFFETLLRLAASIFLQSLIEQVSSHQFNLAYIYGVLLILSLLLNSVFYHNFYYLGYLLNNKIKSCFIFSMSKKVSKLTQHTIRNTQTGKIINMLASDFNSMENMLIYMFKGLIFPINYIFSAILIYFRLGGWGLICIVVPILILPIQLAIGSISGNRLTQLNRHHDQRIKITNQVIEGIRLIKLYGWQDAFYNMIKNLREKQIFQYLLISFNTSIEKAFSCVAGFWGILISMIIIVSTSSISLSSAKILSTMELMIYLNDYNKFGVMGLNYIFSLQVIFERFVSIYKIQNVNLQKINPETRQPQQINQQQSLLLEQKPPQKGQILLQNFNGYWCNKNNEQAILKNLNIFLQKGKFYGITGKIGSGKSTLLSVILKQIPYYSGIFLMKGDVAYVQQQPYIFAGTAKYNIIFGKEYDQQYYNEVVRACCLQSDFKIFPKGDQTVIGQRGITISGGQKARLALARAVYSRSDIYLLDDPISALDAKVGHKIYKNVINGLLKGKTILLVSHQINYLRQCDKILIMQDGEIKRSGAPYEIIKQMIKVLMVEKNNQPSEVRKLSQQNKQSQSEKIQENAQEEDSIPVRFETYFKYFFYHKIKFFTFFTFLFFAVAQTLSLVFIRVISQFDNVIDNKIALISSAKDYFVILIAISLEFFIFVMLKTFAIYCLVLKSNQNMHNDMLNSVLRAPPQYFDKVPTGVLINRFSNDIGIMDLTLNFLILDNADLIIQVVVIFVNIFISLPIYILFAILHISIMIYWYRYSYKIFRQTRTLDLNSKSPIFQNMEAIIEGRTQINIYSQNQQFQDKMIDTIDNSTRSNNSFWFINRIFNSYFTYVSLLFFAAAVFLGTIYLKTPGLFGMIIIIILHFTQNLYYCTNQTMILHGMMICVARVQNLINLNPQFRLRTQYDEEIGFKQQIQQEKKGIINHKTNWPEQATVEFKHFDMRYRKQCDPVLNDLNFSIKHGEKVGIVGRTGAGKSSIIQALFRMTQGQQHSQIFIGSCNIRQMGLHSLRKNISIIPQSSFLFQGTIRQNLDPMKQQSSQNIWSALQESDLKKYIQSLPNKLDTDISNTSQSFSIGQKQLICLARAILKKNKILVLDEATSNVDMKTDDFIQKILKTKFKQQTVITIAHRLNTIADYDRVIVMDKGRIVQNGSPFDLLAENKYDKQITKKGLFADMVLNTGANAKVIFELARRTKEKLN